MGRLPFALIPSENTSIIASSKLKNARHLTRKYEDVFAFPEKDNTLLLWSLWQQRVNTVRINEKVHHLV